MGVLWAYSLFEGATASVVIDMLYILEDVPKDE